MEVNRKSFLKFLSSLKGLFTENLKKNAISIFITLAYIILGTLSLTMLLITNEIMIGTFYKVLIICINLPINIVVSLIFIGKWKGAMSDNETLEKLYGVTLELELRKQEIEHLKLVQQQFTTIADLNEKLSEIEQEYKRKLENERELWGYKCMLAAKDGVVRDAIISNKGWNDSNKTIKNIEQEESKDAE